MPSKSSKIKLENKEVVDKVLLEAAKYFDNFKSQRTDFLEIWKVNDYMFRAGQNTTINGEEKDKGANLGGYDDSTELANTGSTLFHRIVTQLASRGVVVQKSRPLPFHFSPIVNENIFHSQLEADAQAEQWNTLAKYTYKQDKLNIKSIDFWWALTKYGNLPIMITMDKQQGERLITTPKFAQVGQDPMTGDPIMEQQGVEKSKKTLTIRNFPSLKILPIDGIYADVLIGSIQEQDCVILPSVHNKSYLWRGARDGYFDKENVKKIGEREKWDGSTNKDLAQTRMDNQRVDSPLPTVTSQYMVFDIFIRVPINDAGDWDEEGTEPQLYWFTVVGNSIKDGVVLRVDRMIDVDPDDEIPIEFIHDMPDEDDNLYHISRGQIVRSNYSVECTLKNQAIDNGSLMNRPPLLEREGFVRGDNRVFKPHAHWLCDGDIDKAMKEFQVTNTVPNTLNLLEYIRTDTRIALGADKNDLGESFGARTSSNEASIINRANTMPNLVTTNYVMDQMWTFYARKMMSYWNAFAEKDQIVAITDEEQYKTVRPAQLYGDFDIEVDIVDEYESDIMESEELREFMRLVAESPAYTPYVDIPELLKEYAVKRHLKARFIKLPNDEDAVAVANWENQAMMSGAMVYPKPNENHDIHLAQHNPEYLRYKGLEEQYPFSEILKIHIDATKIMKKQAATQKQAPLAAPSGNATPGQVEGNAIAGAAGAAVPQ